VETTRLVPHPYDPGKRERAEKKQVADLKVLKKGRDREAVKRLLGDLEKQAKDESVNLFPIMIDCAKAYVTIQEVCDALRDIFGEYESPNIL
jgi:methylmalonyl-CoA mutase N-terminal domain/subunit